MSLFQQRFRFLTFPGIKWPEIKWPGGKLFGIGLFGVGLPALSAVLEKPGQVLDLTLAAGESRSIALPFDAGDYIAGSFELSNTVANLVLLDAQSKPVRQLLNGQQFNDEFFFIAEKSMTLKLEARAAATARISLHQRIAKRDQRAEPHTFLSPQIAAVAQQLLKNQAQQKTIIEQFWQRISVQGTPLVEQVNEQVIMTFLVRGAERNVVLIGAPTNGKQQLELLPNSDIWYKSFIVPADTRLSYRLAIDAPDLPASANGRWGRLLSVAKADPLNHHPVPEAAPDVYRQESSIVLPQAPVQLWSKTLTPATAQGQLQHHQFTSDILRNQREIVLYRSANFSAAYDNAILLFVFDAREYLSRVPTPRILDNLIAAGRLPPVTAVFIGNSSREGRAKELPNNPDFARFLAQELHPWVKQQLHIDIPASRTALAGSSFGGLASFTVAARYPELFGNVVALSGSFWWKATEANASDSPHVLHLVANKPRLPLRLFLSAGLFEGASDGSPNILDNSRHLRDLLTSKGYEFSYREYATGHDYLAWEGALADGLLALFELQNESTSTPAMREHRNE